MERLPPSTEAFPIDAVVTWVDGDDPRHQARRARYLGLGGQTAQAASAASAATRFRSVGEIDHCLASLIRFAPFLRRIHIVTDQQTPPLLADPARMHGLPRDKLRVVDHQEIFAGLDAELPTFNSLSIESVLHRIPGLAEHFVYLNDDFMLLRPLSPQDWFPDGLPLLRGEWRTQPHRTFKRRLRRWWAGLTGRAEAPGRAGYRDVQALAARRAGFDEMYFHAGHHPHPVRRSLLERHFEAHPDQLQANAKPRWRGAEQFLTPSLAGHLALKQGLAKTSQDLRLAYIKAGDIAGPALRRQLDDAAADPGKLFLCLQSIDESPAQTQAAALDWLSRHLAPALPRNDPASALSPDTHGGEGAPHHA